MAYKASVSSDSSLVDFFSGIGRYLLGGFSHFWNINKGVGWGYNNRQSDVLLVQYLINSTGAATKLVEDGLFGSKTHQAVKDFQKHYNSLGIGSLYPDGVINVATGYSIGGNKIYTIHALNTVYLQNKRIYFGDLRMDPVLPTTLCQVLLMV